MCFFCVFCVFLCDVLILCIFDVYLLTVSLLSLVTFAALVIPDVSFVLAFGGATLGNALIYVFPFLMFRKAIKNKKDPTPGQKREVKLAMGSAGIGIAMGALGAKMALGTL